MDCLIMSSNYRLDDDDDHEIAYFNVRWKIRSLSLVYRTKNHVLNRQPKLKPISSLLNV